MYGMHNLSSNSTVIIINTRTPHTALNRILPFFLTGLLDDLTGTQWLHYVKMCVCLCERESTSNKQGISLKVFSPLTVRVFTLAVMSLLLNRLPPLFPITAYQTPVQYYII